jgi:4-amino-4-deoxy-L-arabinose transferase-like glycosyltransferase
LGRFSRYVLIALFILGVALRIRQYAACPSYWYDEAYLLLNVFHKSFGELLGPLRENQAAPPLFLWLLRGMYQLMGGSEWWMRLPALMASIAGLLVMASWAQRVAGRRSWLWAVAFCALGHHAIAHASEVKPYALDFLMAELVLLAALRCHHGRHIHLCSSSAVRAWPCWFTDFAIEAPYMAGRASCLLAPQVWHLRFPRSSYGNRPSAIRRPRSCARSGSLRFLTCLRLLQP